METRFALVGLGLSLLLTACGASVDEEPESADIGVPSSWAVLPGVGLPSLDFSRGVEVAADGSLALLSDEDQAVESTELAVREGRRGTILVVAPADSSHSDPVWALVRASFSMGVEEVRLAAAQGGQGVYVPVRRAVGALDDSEGPLHLTITVGPEGTIVSGSGGRLAPGCEQVATDAGDTVPVGSQEAALLTRCLESVKREFPDESTLSVTSDSDVSIGRVLRLLAAARGTSTELFPDVRFAVPLPGDAASEEALGEAAGLAPGGSESVVERFLSGSVRVGSLDNESGRGVFDLNRVLPQIRRRIRSIRSCYVRLLAAQPTIRGRVLAQFTIEESGAVTGAVVRDDTTGSDPLVACLLESLAQMRFDPSPDGGSVTYAYPFVFAPLP